jgi:hypothetical protein
MKSVQSEGICNCYLNKKGGLILPHETYYYLFENIEAQNITNECVVLITYNN